MMKLASLLLLIFLLTFLTPGPGYSKVQINKVAPNFKLLGADNKFHQLKQYHGRTVVLEWFNNHCPFVRKHYDSKNMQRMQKRYTDKGVVWLSIISSAPGKQGHVESMQANLDKLSNDSHPTEVLFDPTGMVGKMYGATATPHMFVVTKDGLLAYMGAVDSIASYEKSDISKATNYVANALDAVLAGKKVVKAKTHSYGCSVKYAN
jgi:peroxiredoxin